MFPYDAILNQSGAEGKDCKGDGASLGRLARNCGKTNDKRFKDRLTGCVKKAGIETRQGFPS